MSTRNFTLIQFIDSLLLPDLQKMIDQQLHYYAFSLICQGIELLGAAKDQQPLEEFAESENRFRWALKELFTDIRYRNNQAKFFTFLRGPLTHPIASIRIASAAILGATSTRNRTIRIFIFVGQNNRRAPVVQ